MTKKNNYPPLQTQGWAWGPRRVQLEVSMTQLARLTGLPKSTLSLVESGRMNLTSEVYDKVTAALEAVAMSKAADVPPAEAAPSESTAGAHQLAVDPI